MMLEKHKNHDKSSLTIGFLIDQVMSYPQQLLWQGVSDAAQELGITLMTFPGGALESPRGFEEQANIIYELVNSEQLDGVIIWSGVMDWYIGRAEIETFCRRFLPLPIISLEVDFEGIPSILTDNYQGMKAIMVHLIQDHGYRRIAFIQGPAPHIGAQERYRAYRETLEEYGLPLNPKLITPPTDWLEGTSMIKVLLDERRLQPQIDFDALVGVADGITLQAMRILQARGFRIPDDVAVVGFDDIPESRTFTPPLTTVWPSFYEKGWQAVHLLSAHIRGEEIPERLVVPLKTTIRRSCGCQSQEVTQAANVLTAATAGMLLQTVLETHREHILEEIIQSLGASKKVVEWAQNVLQGFTAEVVQETSGAFLREFYEALRQSAEIGIDVSAWHNALSIMRRYLLPSLLTDMELFARVDALWQQARVIVGETARRVQAYQRVREEQQMNLLHNIGQELIITFDMEELADVLASQLPELDITTCYLALYDHPQSYSYPTHAPQKARLILAYGECGRIDLPPGGATFFCRQLCPPGMKSQKKVQNLIVAPLYFRDRQLGFVMFEVGQREGKIYETLRGTISSALRGALLVQRVQEHAKALTQKNAELIRKQYILDTFMDTIPDPIYFKDRESRFTHVNPALASRLGDNNPANLLGKTDFDLFSPEQAQLRYEQEQEIMRSGQPLLAQEEPGADGIWALTTKMPLRDERGETIGTFGISRDITNLKQVQSSLAQAYEELFSLNAKLKDDNLRYYLKSSLLSAPFEASAAEETIFDRERWNGAWWCVILFKLFPFPSSEAPSLDDRRSIMSVLRELYEEYMAGTRISGLFNRIADSEVALILNVNAESEIHALCDFIASHGKTFIERFDAMLVIGIGETVATPNELHRSYDTAQQAILSRPNTATIHILSPKDIEQCKHESLMFAFPAETEHQLMTAVITGNINKSLKLVREIITQNNLECASYRKLTAVYQRCLRTAGKLLAHHPLPEVEQRETSFFQIFQTTLPETLPELQRCLNEVFQRLTESYAQHYQRRHDRLIQKLIQYLDQQYANPLLSLQSIAETFSLTPKYISDYFKTHAGVNYAEYLLTLRISKAKELLIAQPKQKISEISIQVGFGNTETFIRAFKRLERMTPGMYRKQNFSNF